jgi:DNA-directed RNA polymerase specialized sigma24 family protein
MGSLSTALPPSSAYSRRDAVFQSTLWSQVRVAGRGNTAMERQALETLCRVYWPPIYTFLRRSGHERQNAKDLAQGFFAYLLEEGLLEKANPERGRFRSFLLGTLKFFVSNQQAKERAIKRGGRVNFVPIDAETEDGLFPNEPITHLTPERLFDRKWARSVLAEAMNRLAVEYRRGGLAGQFDLLQAHLTGDAEEHLPALAARLGKSDGAARVLVFRLRNRFRRLIRAVIADTVSDLDQVERELRHLEEALRDD